MIVISRCPICGWEVWAEKPIIKICCGFLVDHEEVEGME